MGFVALSTGEQADRIVADMVSAMGHRPGAASARIRSVATPQGRWSTAGTISAGCHGLGGDHPWDILACDGGPPDSFALASAGSQGDLVVARDVLGLCPLYYLEDRGRPVAFASEMKAFGSRPGEIRVFPPGYAFVGGVFTSFSRVSDWPTKPPAAPEAKTAAREIRRLVEAAVRRGCLGRRGTRAAPVALFLDGSIGSSVVAAAAAAVLGRENLRSFAAGPEGSPGLARARLVAEHLGLRHTERVIDPDDAVRVLPQVVYYVESPDPATVRAALPDHLDAETASDFGCRLALSGEGARDSWTQRVDRTRAAHGLEPRLPLASPGLLAFSRRVPAAWRVDPRSGQDTWLLREAFRGEVPEAAMERPRPRSREGDLLTVAAERLITDADLARERGRPIVRGRTIETKEQLLCLRLFRERFPRESALAVVPWTAPPAAEGEGEEQEAAC